jgi:hypothetical protein
VVRKVASVREITVSELSVLWKGVAKRFLRSYARSIEIYTLKRKEPPVAAPDSFY